MKNFSAIRPAVRWPFQKNSWAGCTIPPPPPLAKVNGQDSTAPVGKPSVQHENFHPLQWTPSTLMRWTRRIAAPSSRRTVPNSAHKKLRPIYWVHLSKIFCWPFLATWFLATRLVLWNFFPWLAIFLAFWASFTSEACQDSLVCQEFCSPDVPSLAQAILCWTPPEIVVAITLLCPTYSA